MSGLLTAQPHTSAEPAPEPWLSELTVSEANEIDDALDTLIASGKSDFSASAADFPLPRVGPKLRAAVRSIEDEPGFAVLRGVPVKGKSQEEVRRIYWGLALHFGVPMIQNHHDASIVDIRDEGWAGRLRVHTSNQAGGFHIDSVDVVGLLCRQSAAQGGHSLLVSAESVRQELSWEYPDLLSALYEPLPFADIGSKDENCPDVFMSPVFGRVNGRTTCRFYIRRILRSQDNPAAPRLTDRQREAVEVMNEVVARPHLITEMQLLPGDLQLVNNHLVLHNRTEFEDDHPETGRHLLRMWFSVPSSRLLPPEFEDAWGTTQPGTLRGSVRAWQLLGEFGQFQRRQAEELGVVIPA